jgi:hypothetical protein
LRALTAVDRVRDVNQAAKRAVLHLMNALGN